jgi:hypothetical protein
MSCSRGRPIGILDKPNIAKQRLNGATGIDHIAGRSLVYSTQFNLGSRARPTTTFATAEWSQYSSQEQQ